MRSSPLVVLMPRDRSPQQAPPLPKEEKSRPSRLQFSPLHPVNQPSGGNIPHKSDKGRSEDPHAPVDLGMLRWIHDTCCIRFEFFCVQDKHPAPPMLVQCGGTAGPNAQTSRNADLGDKEDSPVVNLLIHQLEDQSNVVFTRLTARGPPQPSIVPPVDKALECRCLHDRPFPSTANRYPRSYLRKHSIEADSPWPTQGCPLRRRQP
jgi:hypothetical protein